MTTLEKNIYSQLTENTGTHFLDSGGDKNRAWQKNELKDIRKEESYTVDSNESDEAIICVSAYHHLTNVLDTDHVTTMVNRFLGKSKDVFWVQEAIELLENRYELENISEVFNTYNHGSPLSQNILGLNFEYYGEHYILLQTHNGADIRGGYSRVKCYKYEDFYSSQISPCVEAEGLDGEIMQSYEGYFSQGIKEETIYVY